MAPLTPRALLLLLVTSWLLAAPARAGTVVLISPDAGSEPSWVGKKLDLSPYLGNLGTPGDFKVFSFKDGERRVTVLDVTPWKKGWREVVESTITGADEANGTAFFEDFMIPGRQLLSGSELYDDGLRLYAKKPAKGLKLLVDPRKPQRLKQKTLLFLGDAKIGTARRQAVWTIVGVDDVSTPSGSYPNALRAVSVSGLHLRAPPEDVVYTWNVVSWYAKNVGLVRTEVDVEVTVNGIPQLPDSWDEELLSGRIGGLDFP